MANYYTDIPELKYHLNNPMMERICELKERNYRDKEAVSYTHLISFRQLIVTLAVQQYIPKLFPHRHRVVPGFPVNK